jgi:hypothetical protein
MTMKVAASAVSLLVFLWMLPDTLVRQAAAATSAQPSLQTVWSFDHQGVARFCYDQIPAVIYFKYDAAATKTSIVRKELDGGEHSIGEIPGTPNEVSLSCSDDGTTVAGLDGDRRVLFLLRGTGMSLYRLSRYWPYGFGGMYSLLAPDGKSITLPELPELTHGTDLLKEISVFVVQEDNNRFFQSSGAYLDEDHQIKKYGYIDNTWKEIGTFRKPDNFGVNEIARCGDHEIATLSDDETSKFMVLDESLPMARDWLGRLGVRKILQAHRSSGVVITGSHGRCAFPLHRLDQPAWIGEGIVRFDGQGIQPFLFPDRPIAIATRDVSLSKDGCYTLIQMFKQVPDVPQFTMPQQVRLSRVPAQYCNP